MEYNDMNAQPVHTNENSEILDPPGDFNLEVLLEFLAGMAWKD